MPGPYYHWPGNPVIKSFGVAELIISAAKPPGRAHTLAVSNKHHRLAVIALAFSSPWFITPYSVAHRRSVDYILNVLLTPSLLARLA
ncbi:hypothetical protein [Candidatus Spongiihabitans sp.]|uniref:hypothetical protein n=1 Tax=Candidatus Spongiihabitans sp. TaxID=3101308 RepID=UPI003C7B5997